MSSTLSAAQQDAIRRAVADYWVCWRRYDAEREQAIGHDAYWDRQWCRLVATVRPILRTVHATFGPTGLAFAAQELQRLAHYYGQAPVDVGWWEPLVQGWPVSHPHWRPSQPPKGRSRAIKLDVAPEHRKPIARLVDQFRQTGDEAARQYLVRRMFEIGGVAGVDYAADMLQMPPEQFYEYYPLHISRAIRSGRSGRNARRKGPLGKRPIVEKSHWSWSNRMLGEDDGLPEDLGGKREGRNARRNSVSRLRDRQISQSLR